MSAHDYPTQTIYANGVRLNVHIAGTGGPLVLLCHGFPESWYSWRHQLDALAAAGYRAVALDMRGYGRSSKPTDRAAYSVPRLVEDNVAVVEALGETSAVVVGHDFGAPVAWTSAWTRPDVFCAVAGLSLPFAGRGLAALPGDPFGERRPSEIHAEIAGEDTVFYQDYFADPTYGAESEIEADIRAWLAAGMYTLSGDAPVPPELEGVDLLDLPYEAVIAFTRATMSIPHGNTFFSRFIVPDTLPPWLSQDDFDYLVSELEHGGLRAPLSYYDNADNAWEELAPFVGTPLSVPALFIAGERDTSTVWSRDAARRAHEHVKDLRGEHILAGAGHWLSDERPDEVNRLLLDFLAGL
ncbi:alpha/beta fold hydrolase [Gordonia sp. TBRC 11910]|uniref:Alpha/beta fold hydrolase n=1 Tax=Gordonia asplenii TaxID=2725283 RepID=A0A848KWY5_9ACTN|nr:alpha/beta hydrolase [Gordonia asplenii]NMO02752.1 alpha/beta fold hydrolase [Gordonia asplenii]